MPTNFSYDRPRGTILQTEDSAGYQRTAVLCYLWRLRLDERDARISRQYDEDLNQTTFIVSGLPAMSRPQKLWKDGAEAFGTKLRFEEDGAIAIVSLKSKVFYNPNWEIEIISPA